MFIYQLFNGYSKACTATVLWHNSLIQKEFYTTESEETLGCHGADVRLLWQAPRPPFWWLFDGSELWRFHMDKILESYFAMEYTRGG